ncbi:MAG: NAD-dependent epimerase/dehydratase family protein [Roseimicrobium sp.]
MYLIIGCGYVGGRVAEMLSSTAHSVVAVTHTEASARRIEAEKRVTVFVCDVGELIDVVRLRAQLPSPPNAILHCASSSRGGAEMYEHVFVKGCANLAEVFPTTPIVFTSRTSVYPQTDGSVVTEESDATPDRRTSQFLRAAEDFILLRGGVVARLAAFTVRGAPLC